ncbi:MAG: hypothetical protein NTZ54_14380, partial [Alphaproteobacteria bacterium]|nr:hypothetical protein [Alphaproteobacteria bacterium]
GLARWGDGQRGQSEQEYFFEHLREPSHGQNKKDDPVARVGQEAGNQTLQMLCGFGSDFLHQLAQPLDKEIKIIALRDDPKALM